MFRILHLSDLHARETTEWSTFPILQQAKKTILEQASKENIDLVVFTGDIAFSGKKEEYAIARAWLDDLCLNPSGLNIQKEQILLVPGNHDVDRRMISASAGAIEDALKAAESQSAVARFYDDPDARQTLLKRHTAYFEFCTSFLGTPSSNCHCWSQTFKAGEGRIRVDGLNTSWLCRGADDHRRLLVGQSQLTEVLRAHTEAVKSHGDPDLRITLLHHPLADLMEFDESNTKDHLKQNTDIVLRGHLHKAETVEMMTNTGGFLELAAGALHESHEAPKYFSILDITDDLAELRISTFIWQSGRWILDRNLYQTTNGIGVFSLKKKLDHSAARGAGTSLKGLFDAASADRGDQVGADGKAGGIPSSIPRFQHFPTSQDLSIRQNELEEAVSRLRGNRQLVIHKEPGSKYEGFLGCVISELRGSGTGPLPQALQFRCSGVATGRQLQDVIELNADCTITVFGNLLRDNGECLLILDDLDYPDTGTVATPTIDDTIDALRDFCHNVFIIRLTALPCPPGINPVKVGRLDVADTRSYLNKAPKPVQLTSPTDYARVQRVTGGVPIYLDNFIRDLAVTDLEGALAAQADAQPVVSGDSLHATVVKEIDDLRICSADDLKRSRSLLWTLAILEQGESLTAIKRLDGRAPIWPKNASYLQSRGCLESVTITSKFAAPKRNIPTMEGDKILRIPRLVRDYVLSIMITEEREEIVRSVANLYFSDDWRLGIVRMRRRLAIGTEISTHQSGNELAILKFLLQSPMVYFGSSPSTAFKLALSYISQLKSKGFYGEAYEAAKDTLAIVESMQNVYDKDEIYNVQLLAASCARMVSEREACVKYLQTALPNVRNSGIKSRITDALIDLAMALHSLNRNPEAKTVAKEIVDIAPKDSSDYLQAKALLAEITLDRAEAIPQLRTLAKKARSHGHNTVADNITLDIVSDNDDTEEKLRLLSDIKSRRDMRYNFVRATIRRIETLIDSGRKSELTATDREDLWFSYELAYSQRLAGVFDWCHRVCWKYLEATNSKGQLSDLYMYSSFVWRMRGDAAEELAYSYKLQNEVAKGGIVGTILNIIGYVTRRIAALTK